MKIVRQTQNPIVPFSIHNWWSLMHYIHHHYYSCYYYYYYYYEVLEQLWKYQNTTHNSFQQRRSKRAESGNCWSGTYEYLPQKEAHRVVGLSGLLIIWQHSRNYNARSCFSDPVPVRPVHFSLSWWRIFWRFWVSIKMMSRSDEFLAIWHVINS